MRRKALAALLIATSLLLVPAVASADTTITISGSTALKPLVQDAAEKYQEKNPDVKINVNGGGSGQGITQVAAKAVDIGNSDIIAKNQPSLVDHRVCVIGFAIISHPGANVKSLTKAQIQDVFTGKITNWKDVGGADQKIVVINRPRSSGTRAVFAQTLMGGKAVNESGLVEDATGTVVTVVKQTPGAVSYAALSGTKGQSGFAAIAVENVMPTEDNISNGKYAFWSYEHMYTNGPPSKEVSRFLAFVQSRKEFLTKHSYIAIRDMKVTENDR